MLQSIDSDIWVVDRPLTFFGLALGSTMTVVRLPCGRLWLHSPVTLDGPLKERLDALGPVGFITAPSKVHHMFVSAYLQAYPDAELHVAPGLDKKRKDFKGSTELSAVSPASWKGVLSGQPIEGMPLMNEVVFFHHPSRSLLVTDLLFNICKPKGAWTRFYLFCMGASGGPRQSRMVKFCVRDRSAVARSLSPVFQWPFERVIVAHGSVLESGGREALRRACAWLWRGASQLPPGPMADGDRLGRPAEAPRGESEGRPCPPRP